MRWQVKREADDPLCRWHKWFAWYPVQIGVHWCWLEYVHRKLTWEYCGYGATYQIRGES